MATPATALTIYDRAEQSAIVSTFDSRANELLDLLPDEAAVARFRRGVVVAIAKNPDLLKCTPESILLACFEAATMGLEPTGASGGAHLVPFGNAAQLIPDYRGVIRLVTREPTQVIGIEVGAVKEGDEFAFERGTDGFLRHVPSLAPDRSLKATTHVYALAHLKNGARPLFDVADRADAERIQKRARRSSGPWATDWDEMAKKTILKRLAKVLPVSPEARRVLIREDELAGDVDADPTIPAPVAVGPTKVSRLASRIRNVTPPEEPPAAGDDVAPELTRERFVAIAQEEDLDLELIRPIRAERWPETEGELSDEQRHELLDALREAKASEPAVDDLPF